MERPKQSGIPSWVVGVAIGLCLLAYTSWSAKPKLAAVISSGANISTLGMIPIYDSSGNPMLNARCMWQTVMSDSSGNWSINYANLGFTSIFRASAQSYNPATSSLISNQYFTTVNPPTLTSASGTVTMSVAITILTFSVPILQVASTPVPVPVSVCGS